MLVIFKKFLARGFTWFMQSVVVFRPAVLPVEELAV
jgi:hypothetical protein